ncbi:MAG TPA: SpoIIE family protein phosphatase [Terracidiphilus sp.]|nr:SpoIIE family protein phosphatase [Terracidiphilus sp.]
MLPRSARALWLLAIALCAFLAWQFSVQSRAESHEKQVAISVAPPAGELVLNGLGKGAAPLDGPWQFHLGDNSQWASPYFDDYFWSQLTADKPWGLQGHTSYTGFAWYRRHITISTAPGASREIALLIPAVDDVYEIYWNGKFVGHFGNMPPHWVSYSAVPAQTYGLGRVEGGVLAIRVWKGPLFSTDDGTAGGFESLPMIGSPQAIADAKANLDFQWLHSQQFRFALTSLCALVALLSLLSWLRDRKEWVLFWMAMFASCMVSEIFLNGLRLPISFATLTFLAQVEIAIREMSLWFLLLWLLQLQSNRRLVVLVRKAALISITAGLLDGIVIFLYPGLLGAVPAQIFDAALTPLVIFFEGMPLILVGYAFLQRKSLDSARWTVAFFAFANGMVYFVQNVAYQGIRFTHWTLANKIADPIFHVFDSPVSTILLLRTLLFFSILYAVLRSALEHSRHTAALEQEYQSARELQRVLVPSSLPIIPGFTLTSAYRPAQQVGGDFFQIIPLESGSTLVVLGDVSGKGLMAAMAVSLIVGAVRALADDYPGPGQLLTLLNRRLCGRLQGGFATCVILHIDADCECTVASAGHPAPFINGHELNLPGALPLGISPGVLYDESHFGVQVGDHFSLYTDGLLEARNPSGELYSFARLETLFSRHPSAAQATQAAVNFGQDDDITVLTLTRLATGGESLALNLA